MRGPNATVRRCARLVVVVGGSLKRIRVSVCTWYAQGRSRVASRRKAIVGRQISQQEVRCGAGRGWAATSFWGDVCVCVCRGRREWRGAKWVWVKVLGIYDETTEAIARETLSRCVARVKMSQGEFAILPEASGKCERGVSYRWQSRICFGGATAGALWDGHIEAMAINQWRSPSSPQAALGGRHCFQRKPSRGTTVVFDHGFNVMGCPTSAMRWAWKTQSWESSSVLRARRRRRARLCYIPRTRFLHSDWR